MVAALIKILSLLLITSCGSSKFVEYPKSDEVNDLKLKTSCPIFVDTYKSTVMTMVENKCMDCHSVTKQPSLGFITGDHKTNANQFKNLYQGDLVKLFSKLNNTIPHKGLDVIDSRDEKNISLFFDVKALCEDF